MNFIDDGRKMSQNLLLLVLCVVSGLGNSSSLPQLLLQTPQVAHPVSPYSSDCGKATEVYHQPMSNYVLVSPAIPAVRTLPQLDLSSHWNTINQKLLAWKSSLKSLMEAKMQALKPQFRQQQVMFVPPVAVAPRISYSQPAKKPNCCCNCAPVYTTPKPYTSKPCCCCPTPYTTAKPYTTSKPYRSPICCLNLRIPQTTPYYANMKPYYESPKPYQPTTQPSYSVEKNAYSAKNVDCKEPVAYASNNIPTVDEHKNHQLPSAVNSTIKVQHISSNLTSAKDKNETKFMS